MRIFTGGTEVPETWNNNSSVEALESILPLRVRMSGYGGFEQGGSIGKSLPSDDQRITTRYGDIVLYSGNLKFWA